MIEFKFGALKKMNSFSLNSLLLTSIELDRNQRGVEIAAKIGHTQFIAI